MQITNIQGQIVLYIVSLVTDFEVHYSEVARVTLTKHSILKFFNYDPYLIHSQCVNADAN